ncbi:MAG: hypothetical protein M9887_09815 [Chitinophagales bacterium]|nr:hypothetical protein [Chitinophagales bacterium]
MGKILGLPFFILSVQISMAQTTNKQANMQLEVMRQALLTKDYDLYIHFMYEGALENFSSREEAKSYISAQFAIFENSGIKIKDLQFSRGSKIVSKGKTLQFTVLQQLILSSSEGDASLSSTLIGISKNNGVNWEFLGANTRGKEEMLSIYPELSKDLIFYPSTTQLLNESENK